MRPAALYFALRPPPPSPINAPPPPAIEASLASAWQRSSDRLFDAVREACSPAAWSRGVELVRAEAVLAEASRPGELALRVTTRAGLVSPLVTLREASAEWDCDCAGREDACEHAAAAVIALRRARQQGQDLRTSEAGRIGYRLTRAAAGSRWSACWLGTGDAALPPSRSHRAVACRAFVATPANRGLRVLCTNRAVRSRAGGLHPAGAALGFELYQLDGDRWRPPAGRLAPA